MKCLELGEIVEGPPRDIVDEGLSGSSVGQDDLMCLGLDMIDSVAVAELRKRSAGYRRSVDQSSRFAKNAVDEQRVICSDGQFAMWQKGLPPPPPKDPAAMRTGMSRSVGPKRIETV